jgi:hypothetical protein
VYVIEVNPACFPYRAVCFQGYRRAAGQNCCPADDRTQAARVSAGLRRAAFRTIYGQILLRQISRLSLGQVPGCGYRAGSGDEIDGRSDGRRRELRRSFRQGAACRGPETATRGAVFISVTDHDKQHCRSRDPQICGYGVQAGGHFMAPRRAGSRWHEVERVYKVKEGRPERG